MYQNPNFPAYLNNNLTGLDPITGFDFQLVYYDPIRDDQIFFGKFQEMDFTFDGFDTFNWFLKQGIIDVALFNNLFKVNLNDKENTNFNHQPGFSIIYPELNEGQHISNLYLSKSVMSYISVGTMPGRRIVILEAKGSSYAFSKQTL